MTPDGLQAYRSHSYLWPDHPPWRPGVRRVRPALRGRTRSRTSLHRLLRAKWRQILRIVWRRTSFEFSTSLPPAPRRKWRWLCSSFGPLTTSWRTACRPLANRTPRRTRRFSTAWHEPSGALAAWWAPPFSGNPSNGLGIAGPIVKDSSDVDPIIIDDLRLTPAEQQAYDTAEAGCAADLPEVSVVDWGPINDIEGQMATIARDTKQLPTFAPLSASYRDCVLSKGLDFDDPDLLLNVVKQNYAAAADPEEAVKFECRVAVVDAECRAQYGPISCSSLNPNGEISSTATLQPLSRSRTRGTVSNSRPAQ